MTVIGRQQSAVQGAIVAGPRANLAELVSTDLMLNNLAEGLRAGVSHGLLHDKFDIPFLSRDSKSGDFWIMAPES